MKTKALFLSTCMMLLMACGCSMHVIKGDGNLVTETIAISDYSEVSVNGGNVEYIYQQADSVPSLEITIDKNLKENLEVKVEGDKLIIRPIKRGMNLSPTAFIIKSSSAHLNKVEFAGSGKFTVASPLTTTNLDVSLAGSGNVFLEDTTRAQKVSVDMAGSGKFTANYIESNELGAKIAGSGAIALAGKVHTFSLDIAGSGDVSAFDCEIYDFTSNIAGSGKVDVTVTNSIKSSVAGSGKIRYKGPATQIESSNMGSGSVTKVD